MKYILMLLFCGGAVVLDQWTKLLVVEQIPLYGTVPVLPGLFHLTYVRNTGAAFSMLEGQQWLFALIFLAFTLALVWIFWRKTFPFSAFEEWCVAAIYAGGLGNMIDRLRLGYVVDMIELDFIHFPVFNVADCFITCGCAALIFSLVLLNRNFWKDGKK